MKVLVIGGDATGMTAAGQVKRLLGDSVEVTVLNDQNWVSYSACGIPYLLSGEVPGGLDTLVARTAAKHRANGLDVRIGVRAVGIDPEAQKVTAVHIAEHGKQIVFEYDHLVIATGARPITPNVPGVRLPGVLRVQTLDDAAMALDALGGAPRCAMVVGSGFIGTEVAAATAVRGIPTCVLEQAGTPLPNMDPEMGELIADSMRGAGIDFRGDCAAVEFVPGRDGSVAEVRTAADRFTAELVFVTLGVQPRNELAVGAGMPIGKFGGILVDEHCRVLGQENIWAGGDCVEVRDRITKSNRYLPRGTHANKHGRVIGLQIGGKPARFPGVIATSITKFFDTEIARTGVNHVEALGLGVDVARGVIRARTRAGYFPGASPITVSMVGDRATGRVLGCQIVGGPGSGKRIDTAAVAIWQGMTAHEMIDLDLSYAPPFSPVWDPVQTAARKLAAEIDSAPAAAQS